MIAAVVGLSPIGLATAFAAGFISFASPCVLPLVPGYLSFVSGVAYDDLEANARRVTIATAFFVLGFTAIFALLGGGVGLLGAQIADHRRTLELVGGLVVIGMGAVMMLGARGPLGRVFGGLHGHARPVSGLGAALAGMAFAVGWTPCISPTLTAILGIAATGGGAVDGAVLLTAYGLGLGVPFLLAGLFFTSTLQLLKVLRRWSGALNVAAGAVLIVIGVLLASGELTQITQRFAGTSLF